jgi:hypothetical protein
MLFPFTLYGGVTRPSRRAFHPMKRVRLAAAHSAHADLVHGSVTKFHRKQDNFRLRWNARFLAAVRWGHDIDRVRHVLGTQ